MASQNDITLIVAVLQIATALITAGVAIVEAWRYYRRRNGHA